eukprot:COSAG04_NODE_15073_length_544_cov_9.152411_2_plen_145_part_01
MVAVAASSPLVPGSPRAHRPPAPESGREPKPKPQQHPQQQQQQPDRWKWASNEDRWKWVRIEETEPLRWKLGADPSRSKGLTLDQLDMMMGELFKPSVPQWARGVPSREMEAQNQALQAQQNELRETLTQEQQQNKAKVQELQAS